LGSQSKATVAAALALAALGAGAHDAETNYVLHCQGCHTRDGSGLEGKVPNLRGTIAAFAAIEDGRKYLVQVPGVAQSPLNDAETAAVLNWMLRNLSQESSVAGLQAFTEKEVATYRATRLIQVRETRERLLERIKGQ
jgi:mono/diheme cytochrome c family protein